MRFWEIYWKPCGSFTEMLATDIHAELDRDLYLKKINWLLLFLFRLNVHRLLWLDMQSGQARLSCKACVSCHAFPFIYRHPGSIGVVGILYLEIKLGSNTWHVWSVFRSLYFYLNSASTLWSRYHASDILLRIREASSQRQDLNSVMWNLKCKLWSPNVAVLSGTWNIWGRGLLTCSQQCLLKQHCFHECRCHMTIRCCFSIFIQPYTVIHNAANFWVRLLPGVTDFSILGAAYFGYVTAVV